MTHYYPKKKTIYAELLYAVELFVYDNRFRLFPNKNIFILKAYNFQKLQKKLKIILKKYTGNVSKDSTIFIE